jgi:single-strand DNA-binding protein
MNIVTLAGKLGRLPELKRTPSGMAFTVLSVATDDRIKKGDEWVKVTDWHSVKVWGKRAEWLAENLDKGAAVVVQGKLKHDSWEDKKSGEKKYKTEVLADNVEVMSFGAGRGERGEREVTQGAQRAPQQSFGGGSGGFDDDDSLPF